MKTRGTVAFVVLATVLPMLCGYGLAAAHASNEPTALGPGLVRVELTTRYSRFSSPV